VSVLDDLRAERAKYGATMTDDQCAELINAVAWKNRADGWGVNSKRSGKHGRRYDGELIAHDILHHKPTDHIYDVLIAAGERSEPTFGDLGPNPNAGRPWVAPIAPQGTGPVDPPPPPPPGPDYGARLTAIEQALARIEARLGTLVDLDPVVRATHDYARDALEAIRTRPPAPPGAGVTFPSYSGSVSLPSFLGGQRGITLHPDGTGDKK
jgi:hypothetical protein